MDNSSRGRKLAQERARSDGALIDIANKQTLPDFQRSYGGGWTRKPSDVPEGRLVNNSTKEDFFQGSQFRGEKGSRQMMGTTQALRAALQDSEKRKPKEYKASYRPALTDLELQHLQPPEDFKAKRGLPKIFSGGPECSHTFWRTKQVTFPKSDRGERTPSEHPSEAALPSVGELEMMKFGFATAKLPWIHNKRPPKDDNLDILIKAMCLAVQDEKKMLERGPREQPLTIFEFAQIENPNRATNNYNPGGTHLLNDAELVQHNSKKIRRRVLRALERYPLCDVGELYACDSATWHCISECLGGLSHGVAVRNAMNLMATTAVQPLVRASYHAAACHRQRVVDRKRMVYM